MMTKRFERRYDEGTIIYNWYIDGKKTIDPQIIEDTLNNQDKRIRELESENKQLKERIGFYGDLVDGTCNSIRMKQLHKIIQEMVTND